MVHSSESILIKRYRVTDFPKIVIIKATERKPIPYKGQMKYHNIFEFLNIYSETFVAGGGSSVDSPATKSWLNEVVPELNDKSYQDICFSLKKTLCVIYLSTDQVPDEHIDVLKVMNSKYDPKLKRGLKFSFMWLDAQIELEWLKTFGITSEDLPKVVILNPGKRKRYLKHTQEITVEGLEYTLDKILGGDARFTRIKGQLPKIKLRAK